jgi:hypothetical protein
MVLVLVSVLLLLPLLSLLSMLCREELSLDKLVVFVSLSPLSSSSGKKYTAIAGRLDAALVVVEVEDDDDDDEVVMSASSVSSRAGVDPGTCWTRTSSVTDESLILISAGMSLAF